MERTISKTKRPLIISIICIVGLIGAFLAIPMIFTKTAREINQYYPLVLVFSTVVGIISMIGLWKMKKWAVYTYASLVVFNQIVLLLLHQWHYLSLIVGVVIVSIAFYHIKKMN